MKWLIPSWAAVFLLGVVVNGQEQDIWQKVDEYAELLMDEFQVPALSLGIVLNGTIIRNKGYGFRNIEKQDSVDEKTRFGIGSLTKLFTATMAVKIFSERKLSLDEPIVNLLPKNNTYYLLDRFRSEYITIRDLLSHRTCLFTNDWNLYTGYIVDRDEYVWRTRYLPESCSFRSDFLYNNAMYTTAGWVMEQITGQKWEDLIKQELLNPLEMTESMLLEDMVKNFDHLNAATPYFLSLDGSLKPVDVNLSLRIKPDYPAGGIVSTSTDMMKWMQFHLEEGQGLVDKNALDELYKPVMGQDNPVEAPDKSVHEYYYGYGLGIFTGMSNNYSRLMHDGYWNQYSSLLNLFPQLKLGIVCLTSGPDLVRPDLVAIYLHDLIFELVTNGAGNVDAKEKIKALKTDTKALSSYAADSTSSPLAKDFSLDADHYTGEYGNLVFGNMTVTYENGGLVANSTFFIAPLLATSDADVFLMDIPNSSVVADFLIFETVPFVFSDPQPNGTRNTLEIQMTFNRLSDLLFKRGLKLSDGPVKPWNNTDC